MYTLAGSEQYLDPPNFGKFIFAQILFELGGFNLSNFSAWSNPYVLVCVFRHTIEFF